MSKKNAKPTAKPVAETKPAAVVAPVAATKPVAAKRTSHLKLGPELLAAKASPAEIDAAFTKSFNSRGITDQAWINKRIKIYMNIATKKAAKQAVAVAAVAPKSKAS